MLDRVRYHRRELIVGAGILGGLLVLLGVLAVAVRLTNGTSAPQAAPESTRIASKPTTPSPTTVAPVPPTATDIASWDAIAPVTPSLSAAYAAIDPAARQDPTAFARAFAIELFTRDYRASSRAQLVAWAQYEDSPLRSPAYPQRDWGKVLVDSLTDPTWDTAQDTPIPADGPWLALRSESARQTVSDVKVSLDSQWEQQIGAGYRPPDPLTTVRDVSLTITQRASVGRQATDFTFSIGLAVQLGSSPRGEGYGVAATNNYVVREVG
jgi:hypothetical protein